MHYYKRRLINILLIISMIFNSFYYCNLTVEAKKPEVAIDILEEVEPNENQSPLFIGPKQIKELETIEDFSDEPELLDTEHTYETYLTKRGGVYWNPYTGLKETWYSQRVLPGGGLDIPGRHVNDEGLICDEAGYICVASSTYSKGTIIETSRGMGKVYDSGCAPGILDVYTDW